MKTEINKLDPIIQDEVEATKTELRDGNEFVGYVYTPEQQSLVRHYVVKYPSGNEQVLGYLKNSAFDLQGNYYIEDMVSEINEETNVIFNLLIIGLRDVRNG